MEVEENLEELIKETVPESIRRSTEWGTKVFEEYCARNKIPLDYESIDEEELATILKKFYSSIRKKDGSLYTPSGLVGIRAAIHRKLIAPPFERSINILQGEKFVAANRIFTAKCKIYTVRGNPKPKHKPQISTSDMKKLGEYFTDHQKNNRKLVEYVWFGLCFYFGRRGREGWRDLRSNSFCVKKDEDDHEYVCEGVTMKTKNHQGGSKVSENDYSDPRVYDKPFINAFKLYKEKRNQDECTFFQTPLQFWSENDEVWYKREPMGKNRITTMMNEISKKAKLSQIYTPHCIRASTISILFQAGVQPKQICELTKHRNESSLNSYINGSSSAQKRSCSNILGDALQIQVTFSIFDIFMK